MSKQKRRGQAALEFLMTYGWAILAIMVALGALAYLGVMKPPRMPDRCAFSNSITCDDALLTASNRQINISFINGVGQTIYGVTLVPDGFTATCPGGAGITVGSGQRFYIRCTNIQNTVTLTRDSAVKLKFKLNYKKTPTGFNQVSMGEVYATVQ